MIIGFLKKIMLAAIVRREEERERAE